MRNISFSHQTYGFKSTQHLRKSRLLHYQRDAFKLSTSTGVHSTIKKPITAGTVDYSVSSKK